jgi:hypothetical protein
MGKLCLEIYHISITTKWMTRFKHGYQTLGVFILHGLAHKLEIAIMRKYNFEAHCNMMMCYGYSCAMQSTKDKIALLERGGPPKNGFRVLMT